MSRIAVVGAGIAGLAAAYALQEAGLEVVVLEQADAVGGRMQTHSEQGFTWDAGAQFMMVDYRYMTRLMEKLALPISRHTIPLVTATALPGRLHYGKAGAMSGIVRHPALSVRSKVRLGKVVLAAWRNRHRFDWYQPEKAAPIDTESLRAWGDRAVGQDAVDWLLSVPTSTFFFWDAQETPWWFGAALAWAATRGRWRVMIPEGGMGAVPHALARKLKVRLRTTVHRVESEPGWPVRLRTEDPAGATTLEVDRVILAVPAPVTLSLLSDPDKTLGPQLAAFLRSTRYTSNLTTVAAYDDQPEKLAYGVSIPLALGNPLAAIGWECLKDPRRVPAGKGLAVLMPTHQYSARRRQATDAEIGMELTAAVDALYPGSRSSLLFHRVQRWEHAMPILYPGWSRNLASVLSAPAREACQVFTCGDYWLGPTTEAALVSGLRAALTVLRSLGRAGTSADEMMLVS